MKIIVLYSVFFFSYFVFAQDGFQNSVYIDSSNVNLRITENFSYLITNEVISPKEVIAQNKQLKLYSDSVRDLYTVKDFPKHLWLVTNITNKTNDTLTIVLTTSKTNKTTVFLVSNTETTKNVIGNYLNNEQSYSKELHSSLEFKLLPKESKYLVLKTDLYLHIDFISKLSLYSIPELNTMLLEYYRINNNITLLFAILSGGMFLLFLYNLFMFIKTRQKTYLYYFSYLIFTFLNLALLIDRVQLTITGDFLLYITFFQELTYTLVFIFYALFARSVLPYVSKRLNYFFRIYFILMFAYLVFISKIFLQKEINDTFLDVIIGLSFRITSLLFAFIIIIQLFKNSNKLYIRYIFIGSSILTFSYLLHVIINQIKGPLLSNHFYNIIGSLLEILFFTYALHLKTINIEKEKFMLEDLSLIKTKFFANISHEFRTPLTLIKSPVQSLQSELTDKNQLAKLDLIDKNSNRMLELVNQLLELSKIDSGNLKLIFKEGNINDFLTLLIESFTFQAETNNLTLISSIKKQQEKHYYDKDVLEKIVTNMLSNAIKYAKEGSQISFKCEIENSNLVLKFSNETTDLKAEDINKLFDRFYQNEENKKQGFGIGLALVKELVTLYQGKIETSFKSNILSFQIMLPLQISNPNSIVITNEKQKVSLENASDFESDQPILLLVDDNYEIRSLLKELFKDNYRILEAENGVIALKIAQKEIPDCIISDVMMPKMDGFAFTKAIKTNELTSFIPIILLTANTSDDAHLEGLKSTADAFLTKPFNNAIVIETVLQVINERKRLQERYSQELILKPTDIVVDSYDEKFINKLQIILDQNIANSDFTAEDFANQTNISRMQLHRKLKSLFGVSATEFIRNERVKLAAELLKKESATVSEIGYAVGFNDISYFSKCFKEVFEMSPSEYHKKHSST